MRVFVLALRAVFSFFFFKLTAWICSSLTQSGVCFVANAIHFLGTEIILRWSVLDQLTATVAFDPGYTGNQLRLHVSLYAMWGKCKCQQTHFLFQDDRGLEGAVEWGEGDKKETVIGNRMMHSCTETEPDRSQDMKSESACLFLFLFFVFLGGGQNHSHDLYHI